MKLVAAVRVRPAFYLSLACAFCLGTWLRADQLLAQWVTMDEWHALYMAEHAGWREILGSFGAADHSIPVTLYFKLLLERTGLTQLSIKLPFLLAGAAALLLVPLAFRRHVGDFAAGLLTLLLAISPFLVAHARFARPYPLVFLFGLLAVQQIFRWWEEGRLRHLLTYAALSALCAHLLLVSLPFVLGPFVYFFVRNLLYPGAARLAQKDLVLGAAFTVAATLLLIGLPLYGDFTALSQKANGISLQAAQVAAVLPVLLGGFSLLWLAPVLGLAALGLARALRRRQEFVLLLSVLALLQTLCVLLLAPVGGENPLVLGRYLILVLAVLLLLAALGIVALAERFGQARQRPAALAGAGALLLGALLAGPLPAVYHRPHNGISVHLFAHLLYGEQLPRLQKAVPAFYDELAAAPPASLRIVEAPFRFNGDYYFLYQLQHRQHMAAGFVSELCAPQRKGELTGDSAIRLNAAYPLKDWKALRGADVDYVIFHKQNSAEIDFPHPPPDLDVSACIEAYRHWAGAPHYEDELIAVFAMKAKRSKNAGR